jgi:riboflavin synthase
VNKCEVAVFTGIIEEMGVVKEVGRTLQGGGVTILAKTVLEGLGIGDSVTVNGACLTVVELDSQQFQVDVSPETVKVTTLGTLKAGDPVNLERAMRLSDRLGGHLVTGHVDGVGTIRARAQDADAIQLFIEAPREILRYCVAKGSIAVDGISLTINEVAEHGFRVNIIPHTAKVTTLGIKQAGDAVNLETDLIGKYVERLLQEREGLPRPEVRIDLDYLHKRGLI